MATAEHFVVDRADVTRVVERMAELAAAGAGWINLRAAVDADDVPAPSAGIFAVFGGGGPDVPLCTWVAGEGRKGRAGHPTIGVQHATGVKAAARLAEAGIAVPAGWRVVQDHPKRGLAVQVPADAPHAEVLSWLLRAGEALTRVPLPARWQVAVHVP